MILINPDQYFVIITDSVAAIDYSYSYTFFDANNEGTKIEASQGKIITATSTELQNVNTKIQKISYISIRNIDGALTNHITIAKKIDSLTYAITANVELLTGEFMEYDEASGWKVYDANGEQKFVGSTGPAGPTGTISAGTTAMTLGQLEFINSNNITWGLNGNSLTASFAGGGGGGGNMSWSAGTSSATLDSVVLSNSNGISFGLNGSTITASHNGLTSQSNQALSGSNGSFTFQTATFGNLNGLSFYTSNGSLVGSYSVPSTTGLLSNIRLSAGTLSTNRSDVTFGDSNGISFGLETNGIITATVKTDYLTAQTVQTQNMVSILGSTGNISFANSNGITFGGNASTITASHNGLTSQSNQALSGSNGSFTFQTATFGNLNGLSFYTSNGSLVGSYTVPSVGVTAINISAGTTSNNLTNFVFSNLNGVSFGLDGSTITASVVGQTVQPVAVSASNGSFFFSTLKFREENGVTFGTSVDGIFASVKTDYLTTQTVQPVALSGSNGSFTYSTATFGALNGISFYTSNGSMVASHNALTSQSNQALSGSNGSFTFQTATFGNLNGLSFYTSNGSLVGSYTVPTQSNQTVGLYGVGNTTQNSSTTLDARTISFNGIGALSVGFSNGSIQLSVPTQTVDTNKAGTGFTSAGNNIGLSGTLNTNGLSLSATVAAQSNPNVSLYALGNTTQNSSTVLNVSNLSFNAIGSLTVGYSNGSIQLSAPNALTTQSNQNISLYALGNTTQNSSTVLNASNLSFNAIGSITMGYSNGSIQVSAPNALTSQTNQTLGIYAVSNTTQSTSMTVDARTLSFAGAGVASVGASNGSIIISVPAGGGGLTNINLSAGTTSNNLSAFTLSNSNNISFGLNGSVITASVPAISSLSATGNVSISTNGSTISIGVPNQTLSMYGLGNTTQNSSTALNASAISFNGIGAMTVGYSNGSIQLSVPPITTYNSTVFGKQLEFAQSSSSLGQNSLYFVPEIVHDYITGSIVKFPVMVTLSSSAAGAFTRGHTASFAVYTRQAGTNSSALTMIYSTSYTAAAVMSSNANMSISVITAVQNATSYNTVAANSAGLNLSASVHGAREFIMPWATVLSPGEYWFAHAQSSSSAGGAGNVLAMSHVIGSSVTQNRMGLSLAASNNGIQKNIGLGTYSATSGGFPNAVTITEIRGGATWPVFFMLLDTV